METPLDTAAPLSPESRTRTSPIFSIVYDTDEGLKIQECENRKEATTFVNKVGADKVVRAYKVTEVIEIKTYVKL